MGFVSVLKAVLLFISLVLIGGICAILALFAWGNSNLNRVFTLSFSRVVRFVVGLKLIILHENRLYLKRPAVIIGNHQTGLDLGIIGALCPSGSVIVAKKEIQYIPIFGFFFKAAGNILIDRSKSEDAKKIINQVTDTLLKKNLNLVIFPEGTRNRHADSQVLMLPFKKGAFFLAVSTKLPLVPVICSTLKGKAVWENFDLRGGTVVISVLEPIETKDILPEQVNDFRDRVWHLMEAELKRINEIARNSEMN